MEGRLRQRLRQSRGFFFALFAVVVVWVVASMSDSKTFREVYPVCYDGIDTVKYAITEYDSIVMLDVTSNGFYAFRRGVSQRRVLHINARKALAADTAEVAKLLFPTAELVDQLRAQVDMRGVSQLAAVTPRLQLNVARRQSKTFVPSIDNVQFLFEGNIGLHGEPVVTPSVVTLYGSRSSLDKIDHLSAAPQTVSHIRASGKYAIRLDDSWKKYPDLRISTSSIDIYLPVEQFIECKYSVPITLNDSKGMQYRLYPNLVTVTAMVPLSEFSKVKADDFIVSAIDKGDTAGLLIADVTQFPAGALIKLVQPRKVQFVLIEE